MAARLDRASILAAACLVAISPAEAAERHDIRIGAGRLADAVIALGRQTGSSIGMSDQSLASRPVGPLRGRMSVDRALHRLLAGNDARAVRINDGVWRIVRAPRSAPAAPPPPLIVRMDSPAEQQAEDIIVTATKRAVPLLLYAGMADVVDGGTFRGGEAASGTSALISRVASLSSTHVGAGRNKLFVRAIADSGFAGPTQATTGQYFGDMRLNYAAPDPDLRLHDVGGVELLEGPQGTLYGAGSLGGIIRVIPNPPNLGAFGGRLSAGVSLTQHGDAGADMAGTLNLPMVPETLALRVVGYGSSEGGFIDDRLRGLDDVNRSRIAGGRAALRYAPDDQWTVDVTTLYQRIHGDDAQYASRRAGKLARESPVPQDHESNYWLGSVRVERRWGDMAFVSTSGFVRHMLSERYDASLAPVEPQVFRQRNRTQIFSTENRLSQDMRDGLGWLVGVSYLDSRSTIRRALGTPGRPVPATGVRNGTSEWTLFGEASLQPLDALILTAGGRLTSSHLSGEALDPANALPLAQLARAEAQANRRETIFLPSIALLSDAVPGLALYLRYQQGFRPGGLAVDDERIQRFRNDRISTIEAGLRHGIPGKDALALALGLAYAEWRDIQADLIDRQGLPTTTNIGDGRIYTVEGRVVLRPLAALTVDASAIYNDSRLSQPAPTLRMLSFAGQSLSLPNVANLGGRLAVEYRQRIDSGAEISLSGSARYVGKSRLGVGPIFGRAQGDYVDTAFSAGWRRGVVQLSMSATNLLDATGNRFAFGSPFDPAGDHYTPMRPRTVRLGIDFAF